MSTQRKNFLPEADATGEHSLRMIARLSPATRSNYLERILEFECRWGNTMLFKYEYRHHRD